MCIVQRYLLGNDKGNNMKTLIKVVLGSIGLLAAGAIAVAGHLIYPGTPSRSSSGTVADASTWGRLAFPRSSSKGRDGRRASSVGQALYVGDI